MGRGKRRTAACFLVISLLLSSCRGVPLRTPTTAPSPALTLTPTSIPTSPPTQIPTTTPTPSPTFTPTPVPFRTPVPLPPTAEPFGIVGQIGGPTQAVAVAGNYAYVGLGLRLVILDTSEPGALREMGSSEPFGYFVEDVALSQERAYVAAGGAGLYIVDVSDSTRPAIIANLDTAGYAESVTVVGTYAYVADGPDGLRVIDVTDLAHPVEVSAAYKLNYAFDVAVDAGYAYLAAAGAGLLVADISDPLQPREVGSLDTPGYAFGIAISGDVAYVADGWEGLRILDVSNRVQPESIGIYETQGWAFDIATAGSIAYVADAFSGIQILNVSAPAQPKQLGSYDMLGDHISNLATSGGKVYVASRNKSLSILDVTVPSSPDLVGSYNPVGFAAAVAISGQFAYLAAGIYGLRVVDISDLSLPVEIGGYDTGAFAAGVVVSGAYAYVITTSAGESVPAGMHVINVADPSHPKQVAFYVAANTPRDVVIENGILYIADEAGLEAIDVSDPSAPVRLSALDFSGGDHALLTHATTGVSVSGDRAYVTHADFGLEVVDISDPSKPDWVGNFKSTSVNKTQAVTVGGDFAYVSDAGKLHILDISDPNNPVYAGSYDLPVGVDRMLFAEHTLYLASTAAGFMALDVSDPRNPIRSGLRRLPGYAQWLTVAYDYIFVADGEAGLFIIEDTSNAGQAGQFRTPHSSGRIAENHSISRMPPQYLNSIASPKVQPVSLTMPGQIETTAGKPDTGLAAQVAIQPGITLTVNNTSDAGPGTLREAIEIANQTTGGATIIFDPQVFPIEDPASIYPSSGLPGLLSGNVTIDASNAGVILDGSKSLPDTTGLGIPSDHNTIQGLQIINFPGYGIHVLGASNIIGGDRKLGNGPMGEGNLISGNGSSGVILSGVRAVDNKVAGNYIGTDLTGAKAMGNLIVGVFLVDGASQNIIGGATESERNIISGNIRTEVSIFEKANRNKIIGNYIGIDMGGHTTVGDAVMGVSIELGGFNNVIQANVVGNSVVIADWGSWGNAVIGNFIGVDSTGANPLGASGGVGAVSFNRIGGTEPGERNIISGNGSPGIALGGLNASTVIVAGNYIGTDVTGTKVLGNQGNGIVIYGVLKHSFIGGPSVGEGNLISGNKSNGISLEGYGNDYNFVTGNFIGTDASGINPLPNGDAGVLIGYGEHNFIQGNLIANHKHPGVHITSGGDNRVHHNSFIKNGANDGGNNNQWDDGSEGNYWSDYTGRDEDGNGIGDTPYDVPSNGADHYPLMRPY